MRLELSHYTIDSRHSNNNKGNEIRTEPLYYSIVGTVIIIQAMRLELGHYTIDSRHSNNNTGNEIRTEPLYYR